jgi:3-dehydroquinate synthetase
MTVQPAHATTWEGGALPAPLAVAPPPLFAAPARTPDPAARTWEISASLSISYSVQLCPDVLEPSNPALAGAGADDRRDSCRRFVVVDHRVEELYGRRIRDYFADNEIEALLVTFDACEERKTIDSVLELVGRLDAFKLDRRREPLIAIGGGVLSDVVGLLASMYRRSTPYVRVPTTLMGLVDAGVGIKTGVNHDGHKNRLGSYHAPVHALLDPTFLSTLDRRHVSNGLAEILKIALVCDKRLFELLVLHGPELRRSRFSSPALGDASIEVLVRAIQGMIGQLEPNMWEGELERLVDYGHTFSPTIEMRALPELLHGEAVAIDMAITTIVAWRRGMMTCDQCDQVLEVTRSLGLPTWHDVCGPALLMESLRETTRHRDGLQRLPLQDGIGAGTFVNDVSYTELARACTDLRCAA